MTEPQVTFVEDVPFRTDSATPDNAVSISSVPSPMVRHFRVNPKISPLPTFDELRAEFGTTLEAVKWLPAGFFSYVDSSSPIKFSHSKFYKDGCIYGIDGSSSFSVVSLDPRPGEAVLDVCCAPGGKLALIADALWEWSRSFDKESFAVGLDNRIDRLQITRSILNKYRADNVALIWGDGTRWRWNTDEEDNKWWGPPGPLCCSDPSTFRRKLHILSQTSKVYNSLDTGIPFLMKNGFGVTYRAHDEPPTKKWKRHVQFDRVLVDVECTHDGSARHILKCATNQASQQKWKKKCSSPEALFALQCAILMNAVSLCKQGGVIVYSTCSLESSQNEKVLLYCIERSAGTLKVVPIAPPRSQDEVESLLACDFTCAPIRQGSIPHTIYFDPIQNGEKTSGLFLAKLQKCTPEEKPFGPLNIYSKADMPDTCRSPTEARNELETW